MALFEEWGRTEWFLLFVNAIAVYIVVRFLRAKIRHKLHEVEARQAHERLMRKRAREEDAQASSQEGHSSDETTDG